MPIGKQPFHLLLLLIFAAQLLTMKKTLLLSLITLYVFTGQINLFAQSAAYKDYIEKYRDIAVRKMNEYRIPASITLAQGILESGVGKSALALNANNHFGIKCHKEWSGMTYIMDDDEKNECFRKYSSVEESFNDHSLFLTTRPRYSKLFELDIRDYKGWAHGLKSAGYATNPKYAEILIRIIEENELFLYDNPNFVPKPAETVKNDKADKNTSSADAGKSLLLTPDKVTFVEISDGNRSVYLNNGVKLVFARNGDTPNSIAEDFGIHTFQILRYNELGKDESICEGQVIYIVPKKNKSKQSQHIAAEGETMRNIAQYYGVKLKSLYKINHISEGHEPAKGDKIKLRK